MSELFKALQKLEEQNTPKVPPVFSASGDGKKTKNCPPYLKSVLVCGLLLILAGICLGFTWFVKDYFTSPAAVTKRGNGFKKKQSTIVVQPIAVKSSEETVEAGTHTVSTTTSKLPEHKQVTQKVFSRTDKSLVLKKKNTGQHDAKAKTTVTETHDQINPENQKMILEQFIKDSTSEVVREQNRDRQRKRILYRAEKTREQGDLSKALGLYKKAWSFGHDPDIANNMAALLIQSGKYDEAEHYLQQVVSLTSDNEDLQFNLAIAQEGKRRKKMSLDKQ